ncbi:MAG TPA: lysyl oxidase family protein [Acidimicrobiales bacterium]|nr:lysyl oxidase family protein [Acidimicrobiales bacterium]
MLLLLGALFTTVLSPSQAASATAGLLPDIRTVVPKQVQLVNAHQREVIRFSNGIANTGAGHWRMRPEVVNSPSGVAQNAIQEILDADGNVVDEQLVSRYEFHAEHDHWHIDNVALFEIRSGDPITGPVVGGNSIKVTFCLIDWYKLDDNPAHTEVSYFHCGADRQGISPGWVDQYHQATEGQALDVTGMAPGDYYLVSTSNVGNVFREADYTNNTAWVRFTFERPNGGNPKITLTDRSPCDSPGLCGEQMNNR